MALTPYVTRARALRFARGWTQSEVARRAGLSQTTVGCIERGFSVSPLLLDLVGRVLGCEPAKLRERVFDPTTASAAEPAEPLRPEPPSANAHGVPEPPDLHAKIREERGR